jgi:hypothetical protein
MKGKERKKKKGGRVKSLVIRLLAVIVNGIAGKAPFESD